MLNAISNSAPTFADIGSQITDVFNAGAAAGPIVMLAMAILALVGMIGVAIWKFSPILDTLANKIPQAVQDVRTEAATSNKVSGANATAIADLTETVSSSMATISTSQEKLGEHFVQATDVLSKINDGYALQRTQIDVSIGTANKVLELGKDTQKTVTEIDRNILDGMKKLEGITTLLEEIRKQNDEGKCKGDLDKLTEQIRTMQGEIVSAIKGMYEPKELPVPPNTTAFEIRAEQKPEGVQT